MSELTDDCVRFNRPHSMSYAVEFKLLDGLNYRLRTKMLACMGSRIQPFRTTDTERFSKIFSGKHSFVAGQPETHQKVPVTSRSNTCSLNGRCRS